MAGTTGWECSVMKPFCTSTTTSTGLCATTQMRNKTERLSELLDWNTLGREYQVARAKAVEKVFGVVRPPVATLAAGHSKWGL